MLSGAIDASYSLATKAIGTGAFGSVLKATHKVTNAVRAVKHVAKENDKFITAAQTEIEVLSTMDHPNIVKLYEVYERPERCHLVMEICHGKELYDRIVEKGRLSEQQSAVVMQQLLRAVAYMHSHGVCHRDLKPENIMFQSNAPVEDNTVKVIDFGYAARFVPGERMTRKVGTPDYIDPELVDGSYTESCDIWASGVVLYIMLSGSPPFYGKNTKAVLAMVRAAKYSFDLSAFKKVSAGAKGMIGKLLERPSELRYTAKEALADPWLVATATTATSGATDVSGASVLDVLERLQQFYAAGTLKKVALQVIASQLGDEHRKCLRETFLKLDSDCDGLLQLGELKLGLGGAPPSDGDAEDLVKAMESACGGMLDYTAFLAATLDEALTGREDICRSAFSALDRDGDGRLSSEELRDALRSSASGEQLGEEAVTSLIGEVDQNGDGVIDFDEFMKMMRGRVAAH
jgi:calcium-dependent protein kinase